MALRFLLGLLLFWPATAVTALQQPPRLEALRGESLEFRIRWGIIPAGVATLEVISTSDGLLKLRAEARTLAYIDAIYPVRDRIESTVQAPDVRVLRYFKRAKEGHGKSQEDDVLFDPGKGVARSFRDGRLRKEILVPPGVQDPLSCFYRYRTLDLPGDEVARIDITDGKKLVTGTVSVLARESVETPAGTFQTVLVEPRIEGIGGIFRKSPNARIRIWLTDDEWRRPVKLQSEVVVGSFTAELEKIVAPALRPPDP
jgi:hypothetical protein